MLDMLIAVLALATVAMLALLGYSSLRNALSPVQRTPAAVERKFTRDFDIGIPGCSWMLLHSLAVLGWKPGRSIHRSPAGADDTEVGFTVCVITFSYEGRTQDLTVDENTYVRVSQGDRGLLVCKGEKFMHFLPIDQPTPVER